jgi:hypothetical protein
MQPICATGRAAQIEAFATALNASSGPMMAQVVRPHSNVKLSQLYRLKHVDAKSLANALKKTYPNLQASEPICTDLP